MSKASKASNFRWSAPSSARFTQAFSAAGGLERCGDTGEKGSTDVVIAEMGYGGNSGPTMDLNLWGVFCSVEHLLLHGPSLLRGASLLCLERLLLCGASFALWTSVSLLL